MSRGKALAAIAGIATLAVGTGTAMASIDRSPTGAMSAKATIVKITLGTKANEFTLIPSVRTIPAGRVTFVVHNGGKVEHEFVVLRTKIAASKLPMRAGGQQAKEVGALGEIEEFKPGLTKRLTLTLKPGHHVLLCNVMGHYKAGQYSNFSVK